MRHSELVCLMFHFPTNKAAVLQLVDTSLTFWPEFVLYMYVQCTLTS